MTSIAMVSEHASPLAPLGGVDAGGQNVYVRCLATSLAARGHRITVFTRRDDRAMPVSAPLVPGVTVVHLDAGPARPIDKDDLFPYMDQFAEGLVRHLRRMSVDVVHSHFWMSGYATSLAVESLGVPHVHTFHALGTVKRRNQPDADRSPAARAAEEVRLARDVDGVVATCRDEVDELRAMGATAPISVVPCGFDAAVFRPVGPAAPRLATIRISAVSRPVPRKGLADVMHAMVAVPEAELVVAGGSASGSAAAAGEPHHAELLDLASSLGVAARVKFVGSLPPHDVAALHRSSDLFVAAPWYEPFGIAPVEAMGCGLPVVGTAVGGLLDTVVDGATGVLVPPRDPDALAVALRSLVASPGRRAMLGARATRRAHREYAWPRVAAAMEGVYLEAIAAAVGPLELRA